MDSSEPPTDEHADRGAEWQASPSSVAFPVGLLACAVAFDVIARLGGGDTMALVTYRMMAVGILSAVALAAAGWWRGCRAAGLRRHERPGSAVDVVVVLLFVASWLVRHAHGGLAPPAALWLAFGGAALALLAAAAGRRQRRHRPADADPAAAIASSTLRDAGTAANFAACAPAAALTLPPTGNAS